MKLNYEKKFSFRMSVMFFVLLLAVEFCSVRLLLLDTDPKIAEAVQNMSSKSLYLYDIRGDFYDCNMVKLTDCSYSEKTAVSPTLDGETALFGYKGDEEYKNAEKALAAGAPVLFPEKLKSGSGTTAVRIPLRNDKNQTARHLIGYLNSDGHGVSGLESGLDRLLYSGEKAQLFYPVAASGEVLGVAPRLRENRSSVNDVILTLDARIQQIAENQLKNIKAGAAVVLEDSGEIRAMASYPLYDAEYPEKSLGDRDSPFVNRALTNYSVGSAFKLLTAAAALDSGISPELCFECTGSFSVGGTTLYCHKKDGHGIVDMKTALCESCNCYFFNLGILLGKDKLLKKAADAGLNSGIDIGAGIGSPSARLTDESGEIRFDTDVANFSIGQGRVAASPLAMAAFYESLFNGGVTNPPFAIFKTLNGGALSDVKRDARKRRVMSEKTAKLLKEMLEAAVLGGTGAAAFSDKVSVGGKTATAQTGEKFDGREKNNGWFCGFAECGGRRFIIVTLIEDCETESVSAAAMFKNIAEQTAELFP